MLSVEQPLSPRDVPSSSGILDPILLQGYQKDTAEKYISKILHLYEELSKFQDLSPSPEVNTVFGSLVGVCAETPNESIAEQILTDPRVVKITAHLKHLCSEGECRLEAHWAEKIGNFESETLVDANLLNFPYYSNYVDLTKMELYALFSMSPTTPHKFAFIGSGPLPLTSLCIADFLEKEFKDSPTQVQIHNIDRDPRAISLSSSLCQKLGRRARSLTFQCTEAIEDKQKQDLEEFDVVYLAALVGSSKIQKEQIINDVAGRMRPGALLVLRSAHSLRSLLYPVIDAVADVQRSGLQPLLTVHPYNHIVNSVVIARVIGGGL